MASYSSSTPDAYSMNREISPSPSSSSSSSATSAAGPQKKKMRKVKVSPRNVAINTILQANENASDFTEAVAAASALAAASTSACVRSTSYAAADASADASISESGPPARQESYSVGALTQFVPLSPGTDPATAVAVLENINPALLVQMIEKETFRLSDVPLNELITVHEWSAATGDWGPYPVLKASFGECSQVNLPVPARYMARLEGRQLPFSMIYQGTTQYRGNEIHRLEFIDMRLAQRLIGQ